MKRVAVASIAVAFLLGLDDPAGADVCPPPSAPWLRIAFAGEGFTPALRVRVFEQLGANLRGHGLALCEASGAPAPPVPLADVTLALSAAAVLSLGVRDAVTDKQLARELPLGGVPRDALALSIALAAEELVHASWIEAAFAPRAASPAGAGMGAIPGAVLEVNASEVERMPIVARSPRAWTIDASVMGAAEWASGGQTNGGADVRLAWGGRLALGSRVGLRAGADVQSAHGTIRERELLLGLGVAYSLTPRRARWGGEVGARADLVEVRFTGAAGAGAQGASGGALGAVASGTLGGWLRLGGPWRIVADVAAGAPVQAVTASDAGRTATGISGLVLGLAVGVAATLGE
jgi:hypothetical protein